MHTNIGAKRGRRWLAIVLAAATIVTSAGLSAAVPGRAAASPQTWGVVPVPLPTQGGHPATDTANSLHAVSCPASSFCMAVGRGGSSGLGLAEKWDGAAWSVVAPPAPADGGEGLLAGISCLSATDCVAVGSDISAASSPYAARWDGTAWSDISPPSGISQATSLTAVSCSAATDPSDPSMTGFCMAVGQYYDSSLCFGSLCGGYAPLAYTWNGQAWSERSPAPPGNNINILNSVSCEAYNRCVVAGYYHSDSSAAAQPAEGWATMWNGSGWTTMTTPEPGTSSNNLITVTCPGPALPGQGFECLALGSYSGSSGSGPFATTFDGTSWTRSASAAGLPSAPNVVTCRTDTDCTVVGDQSGPALSVFDGTTWTPAAVASPGPNAQLSSVACPPSGGCTAVGSFQSAGNPTDHPLAETTPPPPGPVVYSATPDRGPSQGGTAVTVTGHGFTGATSVHFGATPAGGFHVDSDGQITATSPPGTPGQVDVTVTTAAGPSAAWWPDEYVLQGPPSVTGLNPAAGPDTGGNGVEITGTGFTGATSVDFGATPATSFTVNSDTDITAVEPAEADGTVDVSVTTPEGTSTVTAADQYTYQVFTPFQVTGLSADQGSEVGGQTLVITGSGFTGADRVEFNGSDLDFSTSTTDFTVDSDTQITVTVPEADVIGSVTVYVDKGESQSTAGGNATYSFIAPEVDSVAPAAGPLNGGNTVVLTGAGLFGAVGVDFGTVAATSFHVDSDTQITAVAPTGAAAGQVGVDVYNNDSHASPAGTYSYQGAVGSTPSATTVTGPAGPVYSGQPVSLTAKVAPASGHGPAPSGSVQLKVNGTAQGSPVSLDGSGTATLPATFPSGGTFQISAVYSGDSTYAASTGLLSQPVTQSGPDLAVALAHTDPFIAGGTGQYTVTVTNHGNQPTSSIGGLGVVLPSGITATSATSGTWSCSLAQGGRNVNCLIGAGMAPGAATTVTVSVAVAADATGGLAAAVVALKEDVNTADNAATDPTAVTVPAGAGSLEIVAGGPAKMIAGQATQLKLVAVNRGKTPVPGPVTLEAVLPHGVPADHTLTGAADGTGWLCRKALVVAGRQIVSCRSVTAIPAGGHSNPLTLTISAPQAAANSRDLLDFDLRGQDGAVLAQTSGQPLTVVSPARAHLRVGFTGPNALTTAGRPYTVEVTNAGKAPTTGPTVVTLDPPPGVTAAAGGGAGWSCAAGTSVNCELNALLPPRANAPPLTLSIQGSPEADAPPVTLAVQVTGQDGAGPVTDRAVVNATLPSSGTPILEPTRTPTGSGGGYDLTVANAGDAASGSSPLTVTESLPAGVTAQATGTGWACSQSGTTLSCTGQPSGIGTGGRSTPIHVSLSAGSGFAGSSVAVSGFAQFTDGAGRIRYSPQSTSSNVPVPTIQAPAQLTPAVLINQAPVHRGQQSQVTLQMTNAGPGDQTSSQYFAMLLPPGVAFVAKTQPQQSAPLYGPNGQTVYNPSGLQQDVGSVNFHLQCDQIGDPVALVCEVSGLKAGDLSQTTVQVAIPSGAPGDLSFRAGKVFGGFGAASSLSTAESNLTSHGAGVLGNATTTTVPVVGFVADAGPAQTLLAGSQDPTGRMVATKVVLDGSGTGASGLPQTFGWTQTLGPKVTWGPVAAGQQPGGGSSLPGFPAGTTFPGGSAAPDSYGPRPSWSVPLGTVTQATTLGFQLTVTDGTEVETAQTTVILDPAGALPPTPPALCLMDLTRGGRDGPVPGLPPCLTAASAPPAAGDRMAAGTITPYRSDANGYPLDYRWKVSQPAEVRVVFTPLPDFSDGNYVSFRWPDRPGQLTFTATVTNGQTDQNGRAERASESVSEGPAPPPLGVTVTAPSAPAVAGSTVALSPTLVNGSYQGQPVTYAWAQLSGPSLALTPAQAAASTLSFTAPAPSATGSSVVLSLVALRGTGSSAVSATTAVTVPLAGAASAGPTIAGAGTLTVAPGGTLALSASSPAPGVTYHWTVVSGGGALTGASTATPTYDAPAGAGQAVIQVTATSGGSSSASQASVQIGSAPTPADTSGAKSACDPASPLGQVFAAAGSDATLALGPLTIDVGQPNLPSGVCDPSVSLSLHDAAGSLGPLTFSGVTGTLTASGLTLTSGTVATPGSWGLGSAAIGADPITIGFAPLGFAGSVTWSGHIPWLTAPGSPTAATTTITFSGAGALGVAASVPVLDGTATIDATVPAGGGPITASVQTTGTRLLGAPVTGQGHITIDGGSVTGAVTLTLASVALGAGTTITGATLTWDHSGVTLRGSARVAGIVTATVTGAYTDSSDWSLAVAAGTSATAGALPAGLNLSGSSVAGSLIETSGNLVYDLKAALTNPWSVSSGNRTVASLANLSAEVTNAPPPTSCSAVSIASGAAWLSVGGTASVSVPGAGAPVSFTVNSCVNLTSGYFVISSAATLNHWQPLSNVDLALDGASLTLARLPAGFTLSIGGNVDAFGVSLGGSLTELPGFTGFAAVVDVPDLSRLGLPLGVGDLVYTTAALPDVASVPGLGLSLPSPDLTGLALPAGFTALSDFTLPGSVSGFLTNDVKLPVDPEVLLSASLGAGTPTLTGTLHVSGGGFTLFDTCGGRARCVGTTLALTGLSLDISLSGTFGIAAAATLTMPRPDTTPATPESIGLAAELTVDVPSLTITAALYTTGELFNLFGVQGLDVSDLAVQGGISFAGPPVPNIGFGATIDDLPPSIANVIGYQTSNPEPLALVVNISETNPIFAVSIGVPNNQDVLKFGSYLGIDDASLIFAPAGGSVGPYTYAPGISIRFDSQVVGVAVHVEAAVTVSPPSISADIDIGAVTIGPLSLDQTTLHLAVSPTSVEFKFSGGIAIGSTTLTGDADVTAGLNRAPALSLQFTGRNLTIGILNISQLTLFAEGSLGGGILPVPGIALGGIVTSSILGQQVTLYGSVQMAVGLGLVGASLYAAPGPLTVGPVTIGGTGCDVSPPPVLPPGVTFPASGACIGAGVNLQSSTPVTVVVDGSVSALGVGASVHGSLDGTGLALSGDLHISSVADAEVAGRLYFGSQLSGVTAADQNGTSRQVQAGDFTLTTSGQVTVPIVGFDVTAKFSVGHLGGDIWAQGQGSIDALGASLTVIGSLNPLSLSGVGTVTVDGYQVVSASVSLGAAGISVAGSLSLGPIASSSFGGTLTWSSGLHFDLTGSAKVSVLGVHVAASAEISNRTGPVTATVTASGSFSSIVSFNSSAAFSTAGDLCLQGSASVVGLTGTATFCSPGEADPGISVAFSAYGFTLSGYIGTGGFDLTAQVSPGNIALDFTVAKVGFIVDASWYFNFEVSSARGFSFAVAGSADLQGCLGGCTQLFGVAITGGAFIEPFTNPPQYGTQACADGTVIVEVEVCGDIPGGVSIVKPDISVGGLIDDVGSLF